MQFFFFEISTVFLGFQSCNGWWVGVCVCWGGGGEQARATALFVKHISVENEQLTENNNDEIELKI
jgi:hypothetical protein